MKFLGLIKCFKCLGVIWEMFFRGWKVGVYDIKSIVSFVGVYEE